MFFFTSKTDIWVQIGRGKVGLSGNIQVKSYIPKSKFDSVIDIRKEYCLYIQNMRKTCWVFLYKDCGENLENGCKCTIKLYCGWDLSLYVFTSGASRGDRLWVPTGPRGLLE